MEEKTLNYVLNLISFVVVACGTFLFIGGIDLINKKEIFLGIICLINSILLISVQLVFIWERCKKELYSNMVTKSRKDIGMHNRECYNSKCPQHMNDEDPIAYCDGKCPE